MSTKNKIHGSGMLANAEERAGSHNTFEIPTRAEREDLWPGDLVQLVFEGIGERLWVKVLTRNDEPDLPFLGIVESESLDTLVRKGDKVDFGPEHVINIAHVILRKTRERHRLRLVDSSRKCMVH